MRSTVRYFVPILIALSFGGCASTQFVSTWKNPDIAIGELDGDKIAAFLISDNESKRLAVEDALARELTARGAEGVAGYKVLSAQDAQDEDVAKKILEEAGVEAVLTMRIVNEEKVSTTSPDTWHQVPYYRNWGGYWVQSWRTVYEPGYTRIDTVVMVETLVYEISSGAKVWAGLSKTTNPDNVDAFVAELATAVDDAIQKSKLMR